ncbi:hypothetical protein [Neisseria yangbaofengii]|uniref:hypothetical protein n=1 Tax=Neisseria yangbaofengii TaxID=2709396 RepID=UPI0013EAD070|nr:hypothetical protein [Neisseria yangbaofengii]
MGTFLKKYIFNQDIFFSGLASFFVMAFLENRIKPDFFTHTFYLENKLIFQIVLYVLFFLGALWVNRFFINREKEKGNA